MIAFIQNQQVRIADFVEKPTSAEERNARLQQVLTHIEENPETWKQSDWHCGTSHCFAGFAQMFARGISLDWEFGRGDLGPYDAGGHSVRAKTDGARWLGLNFRQAYRLFGGGNTLDYIKVIIDDITSAPYYADEVV
jgi:hypothetical protein